MIKVLEEDGCKYVIAEKDGNTAFKEQNQQNGSLEMRLLSNMWKTLGSSNSPEGGGGRKKTGEECAKQNLCDETGLQQHCQPASKLSLCLWSSMAIVDSLDCSNHCNYIQVNKCVEKRVKHCFFSQNIYSQ
jgi:hypothetical protein